VASPDQTGNLHLRRLGPAGIFETFLSYFEGVWSIAVPPAFISRPEPMAAAEG
jgi:hypothetical protein